MDKRRLRQEAANDFMQSLEHLNELLDGDTASAVFEDVSLSADKVLEQDVRPGAVRPDDPLTNPEQHKPAPPDVNVPPP